MVPRFRGLDQKLGERCHNGRKIDTALYSTVKDASLIEMMTGANVQVREYRSSGRYSASNHFSADLRALRATQTPRASNLISTPTAQGEFSALPAIEYGLGEFASTLKVAGGPGIRCHHRA